MPSSPVVHCTVTSRPETALSVTVNSAVPPSAMEASPIVSSGVASSSVIVSVAASTATPSSSAVNVTVSSSSSNMSSIGSSVNCPLPLNSPALIVRSKLSTVV